ncbi:hypothetical protein D1BOALGB6SA_2811 [Olavius sp. associated proteobacterium Delta 1]|nr:hypothetical protein D1BOALGB6SA_2811 [Olavius sp. associated proteobacterium Delta 1]
MHKILILPLLALLLLSCAHGKTDMFPTLDNPAANAQVYVIRDSNLMGWGFSLKVALDEEIIARLRSGEYISFFVKPGFHSLGVSEPTVRVPLEKGNTYYFLISADYTKFGFELHRISNQQAQKWLAKTKPID